MKLAADGYEPEPTQLADVEGCREPMGVQLGKSDPERRPLAR
jgi:hypothetical protein